MRALSQLRRWAGGLVGGGALLVGCSSSDVSLGESRPPEPVPTPEPAPDPTPEPTPEPGYACVVEERGTCIDPAAHCSGRIVTRLGYECGPGTVCCVRLVGVPTPAGGGPSVEDPSAGAGGS